MTALEPYEVVVLAGGAGRRLGGADKAVVEVEGRSLLDRVVAAAAGAERVLVVGPERPPSPGGPGVPARTVTWCREQPPGGGPVAALAAAAPLVTAPYVVALAVDLPLVGTGVVQQLVGAAAGRDGAVGQDASGRDQPLLATYRTEALRRALRSVGDPVGAAVRDLVAGLDLARVPVGDAALDCDTWADVDAAKSLLAARDAGGAGSAGGAGAVGGVA